MPETGRSLSIGTGDLINPGEFHVLKYFASYAEYLGFANHSVLTPRVRFLGSTHPTGIDQSWAKFEGRDSKVSTDRGTGVNISRLKIRGYTDVGYYTRQVGLTSLDYDIPLLTPFRGSGTSAFFSKQLHGFVFGESAWIPTRTQGMLALPSFGGGLSLDTQVLIRAPIRFNLEVQSGTRKDYGGDTTTFLSIESDSLI